ncbi:hypothetical protein IMCC3135_00250 [Granulosicoccus antarcticus IMCC3135]|uniref:BD-FAE-like domain-containing protein n=2 Tax=Granulosicoccus TaxID=437504 RepID=A0A2Z2NFZ7_9GAMM|nr:hypothetical protein IMCC3135_00250 [Granulosicoccus antarcticus IMCC3135]
MSFGQQSILCHATTQLRWVLLLGLLLTTGCSAFKPVNLLNTLIPSSGYTLQSGVTYGADKRQKLDIYSPTEPAIRSRIIVFVYGGAWREGNRGEYTFVAQALADAGHTVIIPDYRLYPSVVFPDFITDVADAIVAAKLTLGKQSGKPVSEVVLMGHSSGAHTAAMLASDPGWLEGSGVTASALIAIAGPYDLPLDNPEVKPVFRNVSGPDQARPIALVTPDHPPTLLIHGEQDERVLPFHTRNYSAALKATGVRVDVRWLEDTGHVASISGIATPLDSDSQNRQRITEFLDSL